jgi:hypothetical protein
MAPGALGAVFKAIKPLFGIQRIPFVKGLTGYAKLSTYPAYVAHFIKLLEPCQPHPGSSLYDILVHVGDLLRLGIGSAFLILPECHPLWFI